ncbi:hypothetical protein BT67DRAFT_250555 [Trichocladium antarcticum]|uniref:DUF7082 domain-containing protein n=1 Tax=Trichocladium antarcticum TaxID=1450529 RepID=A0AAN6UBK0_9PEZI|nr:hypothetical protein BT67DRAFT_250555 [Trichocladium antarcticum]
MSAPKIQQPVYKVYEPGYHPQRTIIVDEQIESPETLTIRLEEEAAQTGGDLDGGCPPGLLPMSTYKPQPPQLHGYAGSAYSQYSAPSFSPQQPAGNVASQSQINQMAFGANSATAGQYLAAQVGPGIGVDVLSCHPNNGSPGTKVSLKVACQYDLLGGSMAASASFVSLLFGSQRCAAQVSRDSRDGNGVCTYTVAAEAPPFLNTACPSLSNVPLALLLENANGEDMARVGNIGAFSYHDGQGVGRRGSTGVSDDGSPPGLGSPKTRTPVQLQRSSPPHQDAQRQAKTADTITHHGIPEDSSTNAYGFPPSVPAASVAEQIQTHAHAHADYPASASGVCGQGSNSVLSPYRGPSFTDPYTRTPPMLRSPHGAGPWMFSGQFDAIRAPSAALTHGGHSSIPSISRPSPTPFQHSSSASPQLIRTSTLSQPANGFPGYGIYQEKASLKISGDLASMAEGWTQEEWENKRRLVLFRKQQTGSVLTVTFKPVSVSERPPHSICISCIWWEEKQACYVTSVDTIHLLEQLLAAPSRFGVDEKNRIRRNLEGFRPATVSKAKAESEEFFKVIMGFGNPKPRNIEKDVKVFHWKDLAGALYKIISKYSASTTAMMAPNGSGHVASAMAVRGGYPALPPTPVSTTSTTDHAATAGYVGAGGHHHPESVASPRSLTAGSSSWSPYGVAARTMSPALKNSPPVTASSLRLSTLPAVYDHRAPTHSLTSPYGLHGPSHHSTHHGHGTYNHSGVSVSQSHARSWDSYSVAEAYPTQSNGGHSQGYGGGGYGDGAQRA